MRSGLPAHREDGLLPSPWATSIGPVALARATAPYSTTPRPRTGRAHFSNGLQSTKEDGPPIFLEWKDFEGVWQNYVIYFSTLCVNYLAK